MAVSTCDPAALVKSAACFSCLPPSHRPYIDIYLLAQGAMLGSQSAKQLASSAVGFSMFTTPQSLAAEVYILAKLNNGSLDPKTLAKSAACFCYTEKIQRWLTTFLLANDTGSSTDYKALMKLAVPYFGLLEQRDWVQLWLYAQVAVAQSALSAAQATPNAIFKASACFLCLDYKTLLSIRTWLLCQIGLVGGFTPAPNLVPPGSVFNASLEFDIPIQPNTCYNLCWGANEVSATLPVSGQTFQSTGAGTCTVFYSSDDTVLQLFGTAPGASVTAAVKNCSCSICVPPPTNLTLQTDATGATVNITWHQALPLGVTATEVWSSTDNITYNKIATIAAPGASSSTASVAIGSFLFIKLRWLHGAIQGPFNVRKVMTGRVSDWAKRVVNNGGALPSANSQSTAMSEFDLTLNQQSIDSLMGSVMCFAPDNLIAALTPLYKVSGNDPWTNHNFVAGDLTINGLVGDAATKFLDSGLNPSTDGANFKRSIILYASVGNNGNTQDFGCADGTYTITVVCQVGFGGSSFWDDPYDGALGRISAANANWSGYIAFVRTNDSVPGSQAAQIYIANGSTVHTTLVSANNQNFGNQVAPNLSMFMFAYNSNGAAAGFCSRRFSFAAECPFALTSAQSLAFFRAIQSLRKAFNGGFL